MNVIGDASGEYTVAERKWSGPDARFVAAIQAMTDRMIDLGPQSGFSVDAEIAVRVAQELRMDVLELDEPPTDEPDDPETVY